MSRSYGVNLHRELGESQRASGRLLVEPAGVLVNLVTKPVDHGLVFGITLYSVKWCEHIPVSTAGVFIGDGIRGSLCARIIFCLLVLPDLLLFHRAIFHLPQYIFELLG